MSELTIVQRDMLNPVADLQSRGRQWLMTLYSWAEQFVAEEYAEVPANEAPWKLLSQTEKDYDAVETLRGDKLHWHIMYQNLVDEKAIEIADGLTEAIRVATGAVVANRRRKRLRWAQVSGYDEIKTLAKQTLVLPDGSAGRQISAFIDKHLDTAEDAGVNESTTLALIARPDKFLINTARALSRVEKEELTEEERQEKVVRVMETAASTQYAADIRREFLNGNKLQIPRDVVAVEDAILVTFICRDEHEYVTLDRKTEAISVPLENALPILSQTQAERSRKQALAELRELIDIYMNYEMTQDLYHCYKADVHSVLEESGVLELIPIDKTENV